MRDLPDISMIHVRHNRISTFAIGTIMYWVVCLAILGLIIFSLFFVVEISTLGPGIIRPLGETSVIHAASNGRIKQLFVRENQFVNRGDTLFSLETDALTIRQKYLTNRLRETKLFIDDLKILTTGGDRKSPHSSLYQESWATFLQNKSEANTRLKKAQSDFRRNQRLHNQMVIANAEFEMYQYELDRAVNEVALIGKAQLNQWQQELINYQTDLAATESELEAVNRDINNLVLLSPVSGTVQRLAGIYPGTIVHSSQDLAHISPDTDLIVEAYISPSQIGHLRVGMKTRFLIDAFNYNQWGVGEGAVIDISNDVHLVNDRLVFKIRCSMDRNYLQLRNGYKGFLKKGMSLKTRFIMTERTLWQLLYDKADDWLNPGR